MVSVKQNLYVLRERASKLFVHNKTHQPLHVWVHRTSVTKAICLPQPSSAALPSLPPEGDFDAQNFQASKKLPDVDLASAQWV